MAGPAVIAGSVLIVGSTLIALFVFVPARRRLKQLQEATVRFGSGDMTARAPDRGGDEVAALARSFNQMGDELANRAHAPQLADDLIDREASLVEARMALFDTMLTRGNLNIRTAVGNNGGVA